MKPPTSQPKYVLGISGKYHHTSQMGDGHNPSAVLLKNGDPVAMAGEERFTRVKYAVGQFPSNAIQFCLGRAGITLDDVEAVGWACDPYLATKRWVKANHPVVKGMAYGIARLLSKSRNGFSKGVALFDPNLRPWETEANQKAPFFHHFRADLSKLRFYCVDHHLSHAASAYYASGFDESTVVTWDGSGDGLTGGIYHGRGPDLEVVQEFSEFSIGEVYWAIHRYLKMSDEGSLMGLAAYGTPQQSFRDLVDARRLYMNLAEISRGTADEAGLGYSKKLLERLGPARLEDDPLLERHKNLAADLQQVVEEFGFEILRRAIEKTGCRNVAFAGGVALNAVMNGKFDRSNLVDEMFVQPEAGDGGGALGAAYVAHRRLGLDIAPKRLEHAYWGIAHSDDEIEKTLETTKVSHQRLSRDELLEAVSEMLSEKRIVGWFQGRAEWGPRALGARSILADPRDPEMLERVNAAIKYRDSWRPFAPSMLEEAAPEYLDSVNYAPFMITTYMVKPEKRAELGAVVHADGSTRPQTVRRSVNPLYYDLIQKFGERTGVPVLLNTSFNLKGEPIVNSPRDALRTFFSSGLDALAMGSFLLRK